MEAQPPSEDSDPDYARDLVIHKARQVFPSEDVAKVMAILDAYGMESYHHEPERVQLAALRISNGNLDRLRGAIDLARKDYRDAFVGAEYLHAFNLSSKADAVSKARAEEEDRRDYLAWLNGDGSGPPIARR